ncbi:MAG TPA: F0F1 ATP synthase subunit gamma [Streptosporangiaceae bacterium]
MAGQLRAIRQRIRGVQSIAKITRAQELIAASRIIKAQQRVRDAGPYARELTQAVEAVVSQSANIDHPLVREPENPQRAAILILSSDRGFAGGYNSNVMREAQGLRARLRERGVEPVTYVSGTKGITWHRFRGLDVAGSWSGFSEKPRHDNAREITETLFEAFSRTAEDGGVDEIHIVYTEFVSMLTQNAAVHRIIPLVIEETTEEPVSGPIPLYEFEPSPQAVLDELLPWYVESRIYQALLEAAASEIAARRRAMKSATDNANDLLEGFTREANKARQAEITQEISEIVGGADALAESVAGKE